MKDIENKMKWAASHISIWRMDITGTGFLEWIDDDGFPNQEIVEYPEGYEGEDDLILFDLAITQGMEKNT